jgi:hypothetical protein
MGKKKQQKSTNHQTCQPVSIAELRRHSTVGLETAAGVLGIGRTKAYGGVPVPRHQGRSQLPRSRPRTPGPARRRPGVRGYSSASGTARFQARQRRLIRDLEALGW